MIRNVHTPAVLALGTALAILFFSGLQVQGQSHNKCENCSSSAQLREHQSIFHSNNLSYQLTHNEAQALAKQGWIHAAY